MFHSCEVGCLGIRAGNISTACQVNFSRLPKKCSDWPIAHDYIFILEMITLPTNYNLTLQSLSRAVKAWIHCWTGDMATIINVTFQLRIARNLCASEGLGGLGKVLAESFGDLDAFLSFLQWRAALVECWCFNGCLASTVTQRPLLLEQVLSYVSPRDAFLHLPNLVRFLI